MAELTLAEAIAARDTLRRAMLTGQKRVTYQDKTVEYRDMAEMRDALALANTVVAELGGTAVGRTRQVLMVTKDDW